MQSFEGWSHGAVFSINNGLELRLDLNKPTVVLLFPRAFTPICTKELALANDELLKKLIKIDANLLCGSTDSPETADVFFGTEHIDYSFIHITPKHRMFSQFIDDYGYTTRTTVFVRNGQVIDSDTIENQEERDLSQILSKARKLLI
jgi:peroxiredoxin